MADDDGVRALVDPVVGVLDAACFYTTLGRMYSIASLRVAFQSFATLVIELSPAKQMLSALGRS